MCELSGICIPIIHHPTCLQKETNKHEIETAERHKTKSIMEVNIREQVEKTKSQREIMRAIIIEARKVLPTLAQIAQKSEFELTISNDKNGFTLTCYTGEPLNLDGEAPANPIEIETIEVPVDIIDNGLTMEENERNRIIQAIVKAQGNLRKAAELLGLSDRSLSKKMKKYDINVGILVKK